MTKKKLLFDMVNILLKFLKIFESLYESWQI